MSVARHVLALLFLVAGSPFISRPARAGTWQQVSYTLETRHPETLADALRTWVLSTGGELSLASETGSGEAASYHLSFDFPGARLDDLQALLEREGVVTDRSFTAPTEPAPDTSTSLALKRTVREKLLSDLTGQRHGADEILRLEQEIQRLDGEIASLEALRRRESGRVSVDIWLSAPVETHPEARVHFGPSVVGSFLTGPDGVETSLGAGLSAHFSRALSLEANLLGLEDGGEAVTLTAGSATYSEHLGGGERAFLNPFVGLRVGYGRDRVLHHFLLQGEIGLEVVHVRQVILEVQARPTLDFSAESAASGMEAGAALLLPF